MEFLFWFGFLVVAVFCNMGTSNFEQNTQVTFPSSYWGISGVISESSQDRAREVLTLNCRKNSIMFYLLM